jgi:hypothetical protein
VIGRIERFIMTDKGPMMAAKVLKTAVNGP